MRANTACALGPHRPQSIMLALTKALSQFMENAAVQFVRFLPPLRGAQSGRGLPHSPAMAGLPRIIGREGPSPPRRDGTPYERKKAGSLREPAF